MLEMLQSHVVNQVWWQWDSENPSVFSSCYHWFNIAEGSVWLIFGGLVLHRFLIERCSWIEPVYAGLFLTFGGSDFREAWEQSTWLIALKGLNILLLLPIRHHIMNRHYPASKLY